MLMRIDAADMTVQQMNFFVTSISKGAYGNV